ncbi:hypothetical protein C8R43DRAFT_1041947 [Mycena crocata]|nr:hypothetical protein C8R43DRAFT_1041947 [Mycena crocata]
MSILARCSKRTLLLRNSSDPFRSVYYCAGARYTHNIRVKNSQTRDKTVVISTLNPASLIPRDYLVLHPRSRISLRFLATENRLPASLICYTPPTDQVVKRFPVWARGFLYYHPGLTSASGYRPVEGSLRFRIIAPRDAKDPVSAFPHGEDLLNAWGLPWTISLPHIACHKYYDELRRQLQREKLVTAHHLGQCRAVVNGRMNTIVDGKKKDKEDVIDLRLPLVYRLDDLFPMNFSLGIAFIVFGRGALHTVKLGDIFRDTIYLSGGQQVWTGRILARFEPSQRPEHAGRRVLLLRVVKLVSPVRVAKTKVAKGVGGEEENAQQAKEEVVGVKRSVDDSDSEPVSVAVSAASSTADSELASSSTSKRDVVNESIENHQEGIKNHEEEEFEMRLPCEGELLHVPSDPTRPWSFDIDGKGNRTQSVAGLRALWDGTVSVGAEV